MQPTKKQAAKLHGSWWGKRHQGPVLRKRNASSLRSCIEHGQELSSKLAAEQEPAPQRTELSDEILKGVPLGVQVPAKPTA